MTQYNVNPETGEVTKKQGEFEKKLNKKVDEVTKTKKKLGNPKAKVMEVAGGGLIERFEYGGEVTMDNSPNSGMITTKGFGASRKT